MKIKKSELSECEVIIMKCIWDAKKEVTCAEIITALEEKYGIKYKDTTVYTFLNNLKRKGFVAGKRKGVTYYWPLRTEEEYQNEVLERAEMFWFGGSAPNFVSALVGSKKLSNEEKEELKRIIDELD